MPSLTAGDAAAAWRQPAATTLSLLDQCETKSQKSSMRMRCRCCHGHSLTHPELGSRCRSRGAETEADQRSHRSRPPLVAALVSLASQPSSLHSHSTRRCSTDRMTMVAHRSTRAVTVIPAACANEVSQSHGLTVPPRHTTGHTNESVHTSAGRRAHGVDRWREQWGGSALASSPSGWSA
jgi:hypothetical protein